jgi:hypothetical protein
LRGVVTVCPRSVLRGVPFFALGVAGGCGVSRPSALPTGMPRDCGCSCFVTQAGASVALPLASLGMREHVLSTWTVGVGPQRYGRDTPQPPQVGGRRGRAWCVVGPE